MLLVLAIVYRNNFVSYMIFWFAFNLICSERKFSRNRFKSYHTVPIGIDL